VANAPRQPVPIETARQIIQRLVLEREQLRRDGAEPQTLEANRLSLAYWQAQVNRSLIAAHRSS
jgi:hypothetical protein